MNDGAIVIVFILPSFYVSLKEIGVVGSDTYTWGIKDFQKCWLGSLAKRRLYLGPAGAINCTPLSALSFWVSLFPRKCGYNTLSMSANLENSAVATGLEKVSFHSNPKERQCQRMFKWPHNCTHLGIGEPGELPSVYRVTQSQTPLKWLSSSSSMLAK